MEIHYQSHRAQLALSDIDMIGASMDSIAMVEEER
jgi:hypothetical protein